jgi:para-nitrobenzyl esterase
MLKRMALLVLIMATAARAEDVVKLDSGEISGAVSKKDGSADVRVYKGIPFAAPPVGALRWKAPARPAPWKGVRACTQLGHACPQPLIPISAVDEEKSEDCLYLNVWTAAEEKGAELPVMVWIHGGSYAFGSGGQAIYDGEALARRGVVLVTINYRLGPFGFLAHPALSKESGHGSGDYGLLDQIAALEWVKRNVAAFGGDPSSVTIFGESAGAGSVTALMISPLAKGLFHRAIAQSGVVYARPLREKAFGQEPAEKTGERFAEALGCGKSDDVLAALRAKSAQELLETAAASVNPLEGAFSFTPVIDGWVIPEDPLLLMGKQPDVPLLIGTTADEGTIFVLANPQARSVANYKKFLESIFSKESERVLAQYPAASDGEVSKALSSFIGDAYFIAPTRVFVRSRANLRSKTFVYHFTRVSPGAKLLGLGAHHAAELRYVFETLDAAGGLGLDKKDRTLSKTIAAAWIRFAKTGDPNGEGLPAWPAYATTKDEHLELGDEIRVGSGLRREACDLLATVWGQLRPPSGKPPRKWY